MSTATDQDYIYYNASFVNTYSPTGPNATPSANIYVPANYSENRSNPVLEDPSQYYGSVIRFDIDAQSIQIFDFAQTASGAADPTYYVVTLQYGGIGYQAGVVYVPTAANLPPFSTPVFSYQEFLDEINTAFAAAYALIPSPPAGSIAPLISYDATTGLISIFVDSANYANGNIKIWMNVPLYQFFYNFKADYVPITGNQNTSLYDSVTNPNGQPLNFQIFTEYNGVNYVPAYIPNISSPSTTVAALKITQEFQNLYQWAELRRIVLGSSSMPMSPEYIGGNNTNSNTSNQLSIVSDFVVQNDAFIGANRSVLTYIPSGEYRYFSLINNNPVYRFDFTFYWVDKYQNIRPILLGPSCGFNIKVLFRKKTAMLAEIPKMIKSYVEREEKGGKLKYRG